jgi:serine/threonine-protein kinase
LPNESRIPLLAAYIARRQGHWEESLQQLQHALSLDPRNLYILQQLSLTYEALHRYDDMATTLDSMLRIDSSDIFNQVRRAWVDLVWLADPKPLHATIHRIVAKDSSASPQIALEWFRLATRERDPIEAERALGTMSEDGCHDENIPFPNSWCRGLVARLRGDQAAARAAFTDARKELEQALHDQPSYAAAICALGVVDAALGNKQEAIREGERAVALMPASQNSVGGPRLLQYLAVIYAWTGETDRAIESLNEAAKLPGDLSYGHLRLDPIWDPLRGDPRFEALVASLAPKEEDSKR